VALLARDIAPTDDCAAIGVPAVFDESVAIRRHEGLKLRLVVNWVAGAHAA